MYLFAAANVDLPSAGRRRGCRYARGVPLLDQRVVEDAAKLAAFIPKEAQLRVAAENAILAGGAVPELQGNLGARPAPRGILVALLGYERARRSRASTSLFEIADRPASAATERWSSSTRLRRFGRSVPSLCSPP